MQETPGRKARAFQLAPRWQKARMQEWRKIEGTDEKLAGQALRRWQKLPWLPQSLEQEAVRELRKSLEQEAVRELGKSLEQEAVRELGYIPNTRQDFARPRKRMTQLARRGKYKSWALRNTMHALQVCAAGWNDNLTWREGKAPPQRLIRFLTRVLSAAEINYPNPETNYSKFTALMLRPKKETGEQPSEKPPDPWRPLKDARDAASAYAETPEGKTRLERAEELFRQWFERDGVPVSGVTTTRAVVITGGFSRVIRPPRRAV